MTSLPHSRGLALVAIWKLVEGALFVAVALAAFHLLHRDVEQTLVNWVRIARINDNRYIAHALAKVGLIDDHRLKQIGAVTLAFAALFFAEGIGLLCRKRWAEYLTVLATASLIPVEGYEMWKHPTMLKAAVFAGNLAVVIYLLAVLRRKGAERKRWDSNPR